MRNHALYCIEVLLLRKKGNYKSYILFYNNFLCMHSSKVYLIIFNNSNRITHQSQNNNVQGPKFNIESYYITRKVCVNNINNNIKKKK